MKLISLLTTIAFFCIGPHLSHAETLYKSIGQDGKVTYSDKPPAGSKVQKKLTFTNLPSSKLPASASSALAKTRDTKTASKPQVIAGKITLYTAAWCGYCRQAKAYLASQKINYREVDIESQSGVVEFARAGGNGAIPLLIAGKESLQGFSPEAYDAFLNAL